MQYKLICVLAGKPIFQQITELKESRARRAGEEKHQNEFAYIYVPIRKWVKQPNTRL